MGMSQPVGYLYWYTTSVILGILTGLNIISIALRYLARRARIDASATAPASAPAPSTTKELDTPCSSPTTSTSASSSDYGKDVEDQQTQQRRLGRVDRFSRAASLALDKYVGLTAIPLPRLRLRFWVKRGRTPGSSVATTEFIWTVVYTLGCLILSFYGSTSRLFPELSVPVLRSL